MGRREGETPHPPKGAPRGLGVVLPCVLGAISTQKASAVFLTEKAKEVRISKKKYPLCQNKGVPRFFSNSVEKRMNRKKRKVGIDLLYETIK